MTSSGTIGSGCSATCSPQSYRHRGDSFPQPRGGTASSEYSSPSVIWIAASCWVKRELSVRRYDNGRRRAESSPKISCNISYIECGRKMALMLAVRHDDFCRL